MKALNADQIKKIAAVKNVFMAVSVLTQVPWQAIAAVWYRESFQTTSPKTPGGPFQFDPKPSSAVLITLLRVFTPLAMQSRLDYIHKGIDDFESAALFAACWLLHQSKFNLKTDHSDAAIKDAFYGYNGRAWGPFPESSPYVYNNFDLQHTNMVIRGSIPDPGSKTGRRFISTIDRRPGAFTVYRQLIDEKV